MSVKLGSALAAVTALGLLVSAGQAAAETCASISEQEVGGLFERWNAALQTDDPDQVTAHYAADAVLLPTKSNQPRTNHAEIRDYFVHFLAAGPTGTINTRFIQIGCNVAKDMGTYSFEMKDGSKVPARYTFVYEFRDGQWLIAHHHSSAMPEG